MKEREIIEGNKLIAEFMGGVYKKDYTGISKAWHFQKSPDVDKVHFYELQYHSSWGWLMSVVEKIESIHEHTSFEIKKGLCFVNNDHTIVAGYQFQVARSTSKNKILCAWETCVQYIKWFNGLKTETHDTSNENER